MFLKRRNLGTKLLPLLLIVTCSAQDMSPGIELYNNRKTDLAKDFFITHEASNDVANYYLGRIAFDKEDYKTAESYFKKAIRQKDDVSDYYAWLGNTIGSYAGEASFFRKGILAPKIKDAYLKAVELDPENINGHWGLIEFYTQAPGVLGGSWEKAEKAARTIKSLNTLEGHDALATVFRRKGEFDKVEQEYIAAAKVDKRRLVNLGIYYQGREEYEKAFSTLEGAYEMNSENLNALYQIGRTSALSGLRADQGIESLNKFLSLDWREGTPSHAGALMRLGMIYEKQGSKEKARVYYEQSLEKDPEMRLAKEGLERVK